MTNPIKKYIHKDQLQNFPLGFFDGEIIFFHTRTTTEQLELIDEIKQHQILGLDTETRPSFEKGVQNPLALIQLYYPHKVVLFQVHKYPLPSPIHHILEDPTFTKIGIGLRDDVRGLRRDHNCELQGMLDLNQFAKSKNFQSIGAQKLSALVLGIYIDKSKQLSNWERIPLSQEQQIYAATDAWITYAIYQKIKDL